MKLRKDFILRHIQSKLAMLYDWLSMLQSWVGFGSIPHQVTPKTCLTVLVACPCSLLLGTDWWMQGNSLRACYHWLTTSAAITAKTATWPTMQESRDGHQQTTCDTPEGVHCTKVEYKWNWTIWSI